MQIFLRELTIYDCAFREFDLAQCVFRTNNAEYSTDVQEKRTALLRNTNASLSLYLSFLNTHTPGTVLSSFLSLSLPVCLKDGSLILYVPAQHTLFPSVPPEEAINTFIEAYRREVTPFTPIIVSLTHSNPHLHFLTVRELEVRLHLQNPIPGTKWCPSQPINFQIRMSICHIPGHINTGFFQCL